MFDDLLNTSPVISKTKFKKRKMYHQDFHSFGPKQNCQDNVAICQTKGLKHFAAILIRYGTVL